MKGKSLRTFLEFVVEPEVRQYCGPIFFTRSIAKSVGNVVASGSFGLVDTGARKLLVTCHHVWEAFQNAQQADDQLKMCICLDKRNPVVFTPAQPINTNQRLDIATFDMSPFLNACGGRQFYPLHQNSVRCVAKGDKLFLIGFPGYLRVESDEFVAFGRQPYGIGVSSVDGLRFHSEIGILKLQPKQFGGISGCPCFLVRKDRPIQLVGFATSLAFETLLGFTHARCLNPDGTINKSA